jgi:hypothetical protein
MVVTNLPSQDAPAPRPQQQHAVLRRERDAVDPLREGHDRLLVALLSAVYVYDGLVGLRGEDMGAAYSNPIRRRRTLLEDVSLSSKWLIFVQEDAGVFRDACVRLRRRGYTGYKVFSEHRCK